jgi:hypothetical protein
MKDENEWSDQSEFCDDQEQQQKQEFEKLLEMLHKKHMRALDYLVAEGFLEKVGDNQYNYTPEGYVLAMDQMKRMLEGTPFPGE